MIKPFYLGMKIDEIRANESDRLKRLVENSFVKLDIKHYVICQRVESFSLNSSKDGCGEKNYLIDVHQESVNCRNCGKDIDISDVEIFREKEIVDINFRGIIEFVLNKLLSISELKIQEIAQGCYIININDYRGVLAFNFLHLDKSVLLQLIKEEERFICIDIDSMQNIFVYKYCKVIPIEKFFEWTSDEIAQQLKYLPAQSEIDNLFIRQSEVEQMLKDIPTNVSWQDFEGPIVDFIYNEIRKKPRKLIEYQNLVKYHPSHATVYINVGGAGNTDYRPINLLEYLEVFFDGNLIIDAKRFSTSEIDNAVLEKVEHHGYKDPSDPSRALILTTKNKVKCWNEIENWRVSTGRYKVVVVTPSILSRILCFFELDTTVLEYLKKFY